MTTQGARYHGVKLAIGGLLLIGAGWLLGYPLITALVALAAYGAWNLINIYRLRWWLQHKPDSELPQSLGMWAEIFNRISTLERTNSEQEEQHRKVIRNFQSLTDALPDATLVIDEHGTIKWFNNTARKILGLRNPEDLGQSVTNLLRGPDFANWLAVQDEVKSKLKMTSPTDENTWFSIVAVDYLEDQRLLILQDVTDVHNMNQVRRDFVANISHEMRTPLTVLFGYLEMLQESDDENSEVVKKMRTQAQQMHELLSDLLELSRLQSDQIIGEEEEINVAALVSQLLEQIEEISRGNHEIEFKIDPDLYIRGISTDIESAFRNLLVNAISYTPAGGKVSVCWCATDEGAEFSVADTGIGIPARDIPRLTERFYRVALDRARATGGTGLGLAIVKHVLNAHQAKLRITSELGEGSKFRCIFPESKIFYQSTQKEAASS